MPVFRFSKAFGVARGAKAFLNLEGGLTRGTVPGAARHYEEQAGDPSEDLRNARVRLREYKDTLKAKNQQIFRLKNELRAAKERGVEGEATETGALPDFAIIGAQKGGTTLLHRLLTQHPHVERGASKEIHYFDLYFDRGIEWYRRCFPPPRWKDGHKTITGEATPEYLFHPSAPERMAQVLPQAKLIALLRNPVDRAYSGYHHVLGNGRETRSFEEAVEAEQRWLLGEGGDEDPDHEQLRTGDIARPPLAYLRRGIYVDQLKRWSEHFDQEQMLVLKSEDFFGRTPETLKVVLKFLGLPEWEPGAWEVRNKGSYEKMDPGVRRRLEAFYEGHNQRLYDHLGKDLGW